MKQGGAYLASCKCTCLGHASKNILTEDGGVDRSCLCHIIRVHVLVEEVRGQIVKLVDAEGRCLVDLGILCKDDIVVVSGWKSSRQGDEQNRLKQS